MTLLAISLSVFMVFATLFFLVCAKVVEIEESRRELHE